MKVNLHWIVVLLIVAALTSTQQGCGEPAEVVTAKLEREAHDKKITYKLPDGRVFAATLPIEYTAKVSQCNKEGCKTRYYYPRSK